MGLSRAAVAATIEPVLDASGFVMLSGTVQRWDPNMPLGTKHGEHDGSFRGETRTYYTDRYDVLDRYVANFFLVCLLLNCIICCAVSLRFFDGTFEGRRLTCRAFFRSKDEHPRYMTLHRLHSMALKYLRAQDIWNDEASRVPLTRGEISSSLEEFLVREDDIESSHASVVGFNYVKLLEPNPLALAGSPQRKGVGMTIEINTAARNGCVVTIKFTPGAWRKARGKWRPVELSA